MLARPGDTELALAFAEAAVAVGDYQGAIAALERILLIDPNRPDIMVRLGELHQLVGASGLARQYTGQALPAVPEGIRQQAEDLLEASGALTQRQVLSGSLFLGGRFETNANAGPPSNNVRLFGVEGPFLADEDKEESDFSAFASGDLDHRYDVGFQAGHRLKTDLLAFGSRYTRVSRSNTLLGDVEFGPRLFADATDGARLSARPFVTGSVLSLNDDLFRTGLGGGLNIRAAVGQDLLLELDGRGVYDDFDDTTKEPTGSDQTGPLYRFAPGLLWVEPSRQPCGPNLVGRSCR